MSSKEAYQRYVEKEYVPVFVQPWLLDVVCGDDGWDVAVIERDGKPTAVWPYHKKKKYGVSYITTPRLIAYMGPYYIVPDQLKKEVSKKKYQASLLTDLATKLPPAKLIDTRWHPDITYWVSLHDAGYKQETRYTYRINLSQSVEEITAAMTDKQRNAIKKGTQSLKIITSDDASTFWKLNKSSFDKKNEAVPYSFDYFSKMDAALHAHDSRKIWFSYESGIATAGAYVVIDKKSAYLTATGRTSDAPREAVSSAIWQAILYAKETGCEFFDFEGSMMPGIAAFFASFGGNLTPFNRIIKTKSNFWNIIFQLIGRL